jgi:ABC-type sugar transport system ATPase subunit
MLEIKNISLEFERPVLKNVSFKVNEGQIIGLVGKSGAGKSSLLNILAGQLSPNEGKVFLRGQKLRNPVSLLVPGYEPIRMVSQDYNLDPYHTVEENIREALISLPEDEKNRRVNQLIKLLKLKEVAAIRASETSGGEQQRLSIARAIAMKPEILLLDEPFSNLDAQLRAGLFQYIMKLRKQENLTIIIVSHDGQDLLGLSDYIYFLNSGKLSSKKTPFNAYYNLKHLRNARLFGIVNQIEKNNEKIRFRPDEYSTSTKAEIDVEFINSMFLGTHYLNYFMTKNNEQVILSSSLPLKDIIKFNVSRKSKPEKY